MINDLRDVLEFVDLLLPYSIEQLLPRPVILRPLPYGQGIIELKADSSKCTVF
jgi:hypothetical protein